jgi:hypothetical protein
LSCKSHLVSVCSKYVCVVCRLVYAFNALAGNCKTQHASC